MFNFGSPTSDLSSSVDFFLNLCELYYPRNATKCRKTQIPLDCVSAGMEIFVSVTAMDAAEDGISLSTVLSVQHQQPLTV